MKINIISFIKSKKNLLLLFLIAILIRILVRIIFINIVSEINNPDLNPLVNILYSTCEPYRDYELWYQSYAYKLLYDPAWTPYEITLADALANNSDPKSILTEIWSPYKITLADTY